MSATHRILLALAPAALAFATGCASIPDGRQAIRTVDVVGANQVEGSDVTDKIATQESPRFLMLFPGVVYDYEIYDRFVLQRDLARVERFYRAKGYYDAHARAGRVFSTDDKHVRVEVVVEEGPPTTVHGVKVVGLDGVPPDVVKAAQRAARVGLRDARPFEEEAFEKAEDGVRRALTDEGYAYAKVKRDAGVDVAAHTADVTFTVTPGPHARFGAVTIEGLGPIPEKQVRLTINIHEGEAYSTADIDAAQQALLDLEVFSSVDIRPQLPDPPPADPVVPLHVKVEPARLRAVKLGGGFEFDLAKTDVHLLAGWEHHNLFGGLRDFQVDFRPGVVLYPLRVDNIVAPTDFLPEEKLRVQLRQPSFLEARTSGFIRPEFNVIPFLPPGRQIATDPAKDTVLGFYEGKAAIGVDRVFFRHLFASLQHNIQVEQPFAYKGALDPNLQLVVISAPQLTTNFDFRDDKIHPHKGIYIGNDLQFAGVGGTARDVRIQPEIRGYIPLGRRFTLAVRGAFGFLLPFNYGDHIRHDELVRHDKSTVGTADPDPAARTRDIETMYFRGFFSGGASSNRGFPLRGIGPHTDAPFFNATVAGRQNASGCGASTDTPADPNAARNGNCFVNVGGASLWEESTELRIAISGPLAAATFCDMSDVSADPGSYRFDHLHLSCGVGARYDTPVGPIRLDVGYRIQPLQVLGASNEEHARANDPTEGIQPTLLGVPIAIAFGIGESF